MLFINFAKNPTIIKFSDENVQDHILKKASVPAFLTLPMLLKTALDFSPCICTLGVAGQNIEEVKNFIFIHYCYFS